MHDGHCPDSDPALESYIKIWKVKRCPKCRGGVHRGHGCALIQCRCGVHFCFPCLQPSCDGQCTAKQPPASSFQSRENRNKYADRIDRYGSDTLPTRESRLEVILRYAGCEHDFHHAQIRTNAQGNSSHKCIICTRNIKSADTPESKKPSAIVDDLRVASGGKINRAMDGDVAWECKCGMIICGKCKGAYMKVFASKPRMKSV
jgi:hypothetical protein